MAEHQERARELRLRLRVLLRAAYALDGGLRELQNLHVLVGPPPALPPERLSLLLAAVEDATAALTGGADPGPPDFADGLTALGLRERVLALWDGVLAPLADVLAAFDAAAEGVQREALPGEAFELLAADVLAAERLLALACVDLASGIRAAAGRPGRKPPGGLTLHPDDFQDTPPTA
jgi:hypothetical protein